MLDRHADGLRIPNPRRGSKNASASQRALAPGPAAHRNGRAGRPGGGDEGPPWQPHPHVPAARRSRVQIAPARMLTERLG